MPPKPLALSDESMRDLFRFAGSLHPDDRGPFLEASPRACASNPRSARVLSRARVARCCRNFSPCRAVRSTSRHDGIGACGRGERDDKRAMGAQGRRIRELD
jgi:hypothetical protein